MPHDFGNEQGELALLARMATEQQQPTPAQDGYEKRGMSGP